MRDRRTSWLCTLAAVALLAPAAGCIITGHGDDDPDCIPIPGGGWAGDFRNPETGTCESFGTGGNECYYEEDYECPPEVCTPLEVIDPPSRGTAADTVGSDDDSAAPQDDRPLPDWAVCYGGCEGLDENSCLATPGCRGAYEGFVCPPDTNCLVPDELTFLECWGTAPSGPVQGQCWDLDAYECSRHDDCIGFYNYFDYGGGDDGSRVAQRKFTQCAPEPTPTVCDDGQTCPIGTHCECVQPPCEPGMACPEVCQTICLPDDPTGCYSDADCGAGYECTAETECLPGPGCENGACPPVCYGRCVPSQDTCAAVDCLPGYHCEESCRTNPACPRGPDGGDCPPVCEATCVPDQTTCASYDCGPGYHCEEQCYPCDPLPDGSGCERNSCYPTCVPNPDPGECFGEVACDALPPECPAGTLPGISGACWSGFCIPESDCDPRDPGSCYGEVACLLLPPSCPEGTVPGVEGNCWSGYCIPVWACTDDPVAECAALDEQGCTARGDCTPIYEGGDCTCRPDGTCTCEEWRFSQCVFNGIEPFP